MYFTRLSSDFRFFVKSCRIPWNTEQIWLFPVKSTKTWKLTSDHSGLRSTGKKSGNPGNQILVQITQIKLGSRQAKSNKTTIPGGRGAWLVDYLASLSKVQCGFVRHKALFGRNRPRRAGPVPACLRSRGVGTPRDTVVRPRIILRGGGRVSWMDGSPWPGYPMTRRLVLKRTVTIFCRQNQSCKNLSID